MNSHAESTTSLKRYLLWWVVGVMWAVWAVLLVAVWHTAEHEAEEITDGQLISVARLWLLTEPQETGAQAALIVPERIRAYVQDIAVVRIVDDRVMTDTHQLPVDWMVQQQLGFFDVEVLTNQQPHIWRVYQTQHMTEQGPERLATLMHIDHRDDLAWDMIQQMLAPVWVLFPLSLLLLVWAVSQAAKPLKRLIQDIEALEGGPNEKLLSNPPFREFQKTVNAVNGLLQKLNAQRSQERAFASDVAHELRTPLASIVLQSHMLSVEYSPQTASDLEAQALKAGSVLSQLLVLARAESSKPQALQTVSLDVLVSHVWPGLQTLAKQYDQQLTYQNRLGSQGLVCVAPVAVELVIQNLVDNALRHTPPKSRIEVRLLKRDQNVMFEVEDWPVQDSSFEGSPTGLGLGLQLVQRLLASQGGDLVVQHKPTSGRLTQAFWPIAVA